MPVTMYSALETWVTVFSAVCTARAGVVGAAVRSLIFERVKLTGAAERSSSVSKSRRCLRRKACEWRRILLRNRDDNVSRRLALKRHAARDHFIDHDAETPDVAACVDGLAACLLGRHVMRRTHHDARVG